MVHTIYTDSHIFVCVKPRGVLSEGEGTNAMPVLIAEELRARGRTTEVFPVHRLDKETEGLMVYALTAAAAAALSRSIVEGRLEKDYLAVVCGKPEKDCDRLTDLLFYDKARSKSFVVDRQRKGVKKAILDYELLETQETHSLLRIRLLTGRTHQIRVQFASRGLPLCGDRRYGAPSEGLPLALYAHRLSFPHPNTGEPMEFRSSPTPEKATAWADWSTL